MDYRKLNDFTVDNKYSLLNIFDSLEQLVKSQYFTTVGLVSEFHQTKIDPRKDIQFAKNGAL